ncbi:sugar transferase [Allofournierella sp.]|uniref:sugar transferase n=1 Tax=Allofournierella sp. TaxID=1940256 RepID=UPI003AB63079
MIRQNQRLVNLINRLLDAVLIVAAYLLANWLRLDFMVHRDASLKAIFDAEYTSAAVLYAFIMVALYSLLRLYGSFRFKMFWQECLTLAAANAVGVLGIGAVLYVVRLEDFSRLVIALFYVFSTGFVILKRVATRALLDHYRSLGYNQRALLLVGGGELAHRYYEEVKNNPQYGYFFMGYVAPEKNQCMTPYLGGYEMFRPFLETRNIDEVVIAMQHTERKQVGDMIATCGRYGAKVSVIPAYNDYIPGLPKIEQAGSLKLFNVRSTPDKGPIWAGVKRVMDVVGSIIGIVLSGPVMLGVAVAVKRCDRGPVLFVQTRVGKNGKEFKMYKFRSMYMDAESRLEELKKYNQVKGPAFKMENDPRVTKVGKFIRKTSLDELPQFFNVLKGDMSIVGPRPPLPREVAQYSDWDWGRLAVKPGLTCYWQISGRSDVSFEDWMKLDLKYVEEQSFWTDLKILWKTVSVVLHGTGAY